MDKPLLLLDVDGPLLIGLKELDFRQAGAWLDELKERND